MEQTDLLRHLVEVLEGLEVRYMVVGSIASSHFGLARMTNDIDIVADLREDDAIPLCRAFPANEYYVSEEAVREAIRRGGQFNIIHPTSGSKIDMMAVPPTAWGRSQMARRHRVLLMPDLEGYCARPEDVIIGKLIYYQEGGSDKHLRDIASMLKVSGDIIDRDYVAKWAAEMGLVEIWQDILKKVESKK